jgi:hypothetical protein
MTTTTKLEAALAYASWGWPVFPLVALRKNPATPDGFYNATTDMDQIKAWWAQNPEYNIGIPTGEVSGIVVFDIDPRNGGDDSWPTFQRELGNVPDDAMCQLTAGGGEHYIAKWYEGLKSCHPRPGIDFLSTGNYFVASPSFVIPTKDGTIESARTYEWEASGDPADGAIPFSIPELWRVALAVKKVISNASDSPLIVGSRNVGLTAMGGLMRHGGFSGAEIYAALSKANEDRCEIPLPDSEVRQIAQSIARYTPDHDVGASAALGDSAAESILSDQPKHPLAVFVDYDMGNIPAQEYVLDGLIQSGVVLIAGSAGAGKTTQLVPIATRVAHLCDPDDSLKPLLRRKIIWVSEDPRQVMRILRSMRESGHLGGKSDAEVSEWFKIVSAARLAPQIVAQVAPFYESMAINNISEDGVIYETNPLVVFDTTNASFDLENESDNSEVGRAMATLKGRFHSMPLWLVAHLAKALKRADVADFSARGAGAWEADANQVLYLIKEDDGKRWLEIVSAKHRFMARADGILFGASINVINTYDMLGNPIKESLIHGVPQVMSANGRADIKKQKEVDRKKGEEFARTQAENDRKQIAIDALKQLRRGEYLTKDELFTRMKGDKAKTLALIDLMVQKNEIDEMFKPFPAHIQTRPGRHGSGYMLPKNYKAESDGE